MRFLDDFEREKDQDILDYNNASFKEVTKGETVAGVLTPRWKARHHLKKMRLGHAQKSQLQTAKLGMFGVTCHSG